MAFLFRRNAHSRPTCLSEAQNYVSDPHSRASDPLHYVSDPHDFISEVQRLVSETLHYVSDPHSRASETLHCTSDPHRLASDPHFRVLVPHPRASKTRPTAMPTHPRPSDRHGHESDHADSVRAMFDSIAPTYDLVNRALSLGIDQRWRRRALNVLARELPEGDVLDLCAGSLDLSALAEARFPPRKIVALDFSPEMLARGAKKVHRTEVHCGDAMNLPFADASFAGIICGFGLRNLSDPRKSIIEASRVLKPGGRLVYLEFFRPEHASWRRKLAQMYNTSMVRTLGRWVSGSSSAYDYLVASMEHFFSARELQDHLRQAGLRDVQSECLTLDIASIVSCTKP
jgi:ubiquinone/menaquinone biosynthesis methyltransferase